ncbi:MAG: hypothetical protein OXU20_24495 [Myxococcales bacterium]|nr:hypothetical protein [Myxococcales bacterium]
MEFEPRRCDRWGSRAQRLLCAVAALSSFLTYEGLAIVKDSPTALALALVAALVQLVAWTYFFEVLPRAGGQARRQLTVAAVVACITVTVTSTWFSFFGLVSAPAQQMHMAYVIDDGTKMLATLSERRQAEAPLHPIIEQSATSAERLAKQEKRGGFGGRRGTGPIHTTLVGLAGTYEDAASILEEREQAVDSARQVAQSTLGEMRSLLLRFQAEKGGSATEITSRFASLLFVLNDQFAVLQQSSVPTAVAVVQKAEQLVESIPITGRSRRTVERQEAAKAAIMRIAKDTRRGIETQAQQLDTQKVQVVPYRMLMPIEAVLAHTFPTLASYFAYPLVFDIGIPLMLLVFLMVLAGPTREQDVVRVQRVAQEGTREPVAVHRPAAFGTTSGSNGGDRADRFGAILSELRAARRQPEA